MKRISLVAILLIHAASAVAQVDEARQAIDRGEYVRAVNILSDALCVRPTPDAYLYLGIAYRGMKEYRKAEDVFNEGGKRYPDDPRFHNELANLFIENNDIDAAKSELRRALDIDPNNVYASDRLATIDMSEGEVQSALKSWNKSGRPYINDILHNYYFNYGSWVLGKAAAFHPAATLRYSQWKTTQTRLFETGLFSNVGLEIEPTRVPDQYNAIVRTSQKTNSPADFLFNAAKGTPFQTSFVDVWNIGNSGVNFNGNYRWEAERRRVAGRFKIPLPVSGLLHLELGTNWWSEQWNTTNVILPQFLPDALFNYKGTAFYGGVKHIPNYRVQLAAGFEYRNRAASGDLPQLETNSSNTGVFTGETNLLLHEGKLQSRLDLEGFAARPSILGNLRFTGGVAQLSNRVTLSKDTQTYFDLSLKGGTARGALPFDYYFLVGLDTKTVNPLRAHVVEKDGRYGHGPTGTDFVLVSTDVERRLATIPLFNSLNIPFVTVKWEVSFDGAKTWDRNRVFQQGKLWLDAGAGLRFETPTDSFNLVYGRSLREGKNVFFAYYERRLW